MFIYLLSSAYAKNNPSLEKGKKAECDHIEKKYVTKYSEINKIGYNI